MSENKTYIIHSWNPGAELTMVIILGFAIISSIFSFIFSNTILISIVIAICEIVVGILYFSKWKMEYASKKYQEHKAIEIYVWGIVIILFIIAIILIPIGIKNIIFFHDILEMGKANEYHKDILERDKKSLIESIMAFAFVIDLIYPLIHCIVYSKFYKKYEEDKINAENDKKQGKK